MSKINASGQARRIWRILPVMPGEMLVHAAQQAEADGVEGVFCAQLYGPPFIPLAAVAAVTERLKIASGIAIAASRSPFETAMAARDLDLLSNGRFTLGLGTSVPEWINGIFGSPGIKPLAHMRDTVAAIRHIHATAHEELKPYEGEYYKADFEAFQTMLPPPVKKEMPIWLAAMREKLTRMAVEIGDGVIGHPIWSRDWTLNTIKPVIEDELKKCNKKRSDIEVSIWPWALPNSNEKEALDDARPTVSFYAGIKAYEPYFEAHGFLKEARALQTAFLEEGYFKASRLIPDEMVRAFIAIGDLDKIRDEVEPIWGVADSICVIPPVHAMTPEKIQFYSDGIAEAFSSPDAV